MILVDTNVLVDVLQNDPEWADWSTEQLRRQSQVHELIINPIIYTELSVNFESVEGLDKSVEELEVRLLEIPRPALFLAGRAFIRYRRAGGERNNVLADFFIGAHAAVLRCPILTRDARAYRTYFPTVRVMAPE